MELAVGLAARSEAAANAISALASYPFRELTPLGDGDTVGWGNGHALLTSCPPGDAPDLAGLEQEGEPVTWLWIIPISAPEREFARAHGWAALRERLAAEGRTWMAPAG